MNRYKMIIEYDGSNFAGYQVQPEKRTIQGEIEKVLEFLLKESVKTYASGRTDAGVSALGQVAHFDTEQNLPEKKFMSSMNALLPEDIAIVDFCKAKDGFDARFSAKQKTYQYRFYISRFSRPLFARSALRINDYADLNLMKKACSEFIGTFDFASFVSKKSGKTDFVRTIFDAKIVELGNGVYAFEITGNGFLYNMVRIIFGTILAVGYGKIDVSQIKNILEGKCRSLAGKTMPAFPLVLKDVQYAEN